MSRDLESKQVEIEVEVRRETHLALLVFDGKKEVWVPRSLITDYTEEKDLASTKITSIFIPEWFALKEGLI